MTQNLKQKIEAILFTIGKRISIEEISKLSNIQNPQLILELLNQLKTEYEKKDSSLRLINNDNIWKMSVKTEYGEIVDNIITDTELSKSIMETLAVIAWKHPTLQSEVVHVRTNKAYEDLKELEEQGFITRIKYGRTRKINLTEKFFNYFDLPERKKQAKILKKLVPEEVKEKVSDTEQEIKQGEKAIENYKIKQKLDKQKQEQLKTFNSSQKEIFLAIESAKQK